MSKNVSDSTPDDPVFTAVELQTLEKLNAETRAWIQLVTDNQKQKKDHETPAFTIAEVEAKMADLDREIKYLINKAKIHKPKPKAEKKEEKPKDEEATKAEESAKEGGEEKKKDEPVADDEKTIPPTTPETEEKPAEGAPPPLEKPTEAKAESPDEKTKTEAGGADDTHKPDDELWSVRIL